MILQPPATLLLGPPGSGKTDSLATLIEAGLELFVIITEPDGNVSLIDSLHRRNLSLDKLHWSVVPPTTSGWAALDDVVNKIGTMSYESIADIKSGIGKTETRQAAMKFLEQLKNFHCERTNKNYGDVTKWGEDRALVIDSFSGLSLIAWQLTVGFKPTAHQGEWGVAMNFLEQLLLKMTGDRRCFFAMTSHVEKELSEITGASQLMVSTLGRKLAPKIPRFFSEVVMAKRQLAGTVAKFSWSTVESNADLKNRTLKIGNDLTPSFVPIVQAYRNRQKLAGAPSQPAPSAGAVTPLQMKDFPQNLPAAGLKPVIPTS